MSSDKANALLFGPWLRQRRRTLDMTQENLARQANCAVVSIRKIESGDLVPSKDLANQLALALAIPTAQHEAFVAFARTPHITAPGSAFANAATDSIPVTTHRYHLPSPLTATIGREHATHVGCTLLRQPGVRLVTLTGPPGTGKTRLSLEIADALQAEFAHGACFVALAPLDHPSLVEAAIAQALEVRESAQQPLNVALQNHLRDKNLLLVLDNFEHVLPAATVINELLAAAPGVRALASSREPLRVYGEHELPVTPLELPSVERLPPFEALEEYAAVRLFVERAQAVAPDFVLTRENAATVAGICTQLDGLPLAIEMAAARIKWHPASVVLEQLHHHLPSLGSSLRGREPRQQTLRGALDWSYDLLDPHQQRLFATLGVFVGGCTEDAVETVCDEPNLRADLQSLVEKSLLLYQRAANNVPRFSMLEIIRVYAREKLEASGELFRVQQRHAAQYAILAQTAAPALLAGAQQVAWLERLTLEQHNLRAALAWTLEHAKDPTAALVFTDSLFLFWQNRSAFAEGRRWLEAAAARSTEPTLLRARVLNRAGGFAWSQGDDHHAQMLQEQALAIQETIGDQGEISRSLQHLGIIAGRQSEDERARALFERSLVIERTLGNTPGIVAAAINLAIVVQRQGDYHRAGALLEECITLSGKVDDRRGMAQALLVQGRLNRRLGKYEQAARGFQHSLTLWHALGNRLGVAGALEYLAEIAITQGHATHAAHLLGTAEVLREEIGAPIGADERKFYDDAVARLHMLLDESTYAAWQEGRALPFAAVVDLATVLR